MSDRPDAPQAPGPRPPRVSVVVPAFRNADYIAATMDSVLAQTYPDLEVVVADHSSTDGTWEILQRYAADPRVRLLRTPAGGGAKRNWDAVSREARGELLKLVCGDDLVRPTLVEEQVRAFDEGGEDVVLVASQRDLVDADGRVFVRGRGLAGLRGRLPGAQALRVTVRAGTNVFGEPACVLLRRSALEAAGWWDDTSPYYIDAGTYARVLVQGDFVPVRRSLAAFRVSASQWSVRLMRDQARQAAVFHRSARALAPEAVSAADVRRGDALAQVAALQRRAAYLVLGRRMRPRAGAGAAASA
ncbi:glycosyltransferase family 2 protein [Cellulomonas endophytica]|uniref:glycosyltransferase family 2 protein n=1 Tax=Cellulomonas endophytica TaxID=2494735 RepID=UPI0013E934CE|nr:glycosyltransferase family 2 protein [Cellulomonas endophytica]